MTARRIPRDASSRARLARSWLARAGPHARRTAPDASRVAEGRHHPLPWRLEAALRAVHRSEQALLLFEASTLVVRLRPLAAWLGADPLPLDEVDPGSFQLWLRRAHDELELAFEDRAPVPDELRACSRSGAAGWGADAAERLARTGLRLDPGPVAHAVLARALVSRHAPDAGLRELDAALADEGIEWLPDQTRFRRQLDRCRALAFEQRGDLWAALASLTTSLPCVLAPDSADGPALAATLALALVLGEAAVAEEMAERLEGHGLEVLSAHGASALGARVRGWRALSVGPGAALPLQSRRLARRWMTCGHPLLAQLARTAVG